MNIIKKKIFNILRSYVKTYLTGKLGKVVEDDEKLICYVKKRKLKEEDYSYTIRCSGVKLIDKKLAKAYKLDKPICYVIDGLEFVKNVVEIDGNNNCEVVIRNCRFNYGLSVRAFKKCTLENTFIREINFSPVVSADELVIKDMDIKNYFMLVGNASLISFFANDKIDIINSNIGNEIERTKVSIIATNELNFVNSKIAGNGVKCKTKKITSDSNSSIVAIEKVELEIDDFEKINITSPTVIYNGNEFFNEEKLAVLEKVEDSLKLKRFEFLQLLNEIKNECEKSNSQKVDKCIESLNNQSISKVLKK